MRKSILVTGIATLLVGGSGIAYAATTNQPDHYTFCAQRSGYLKLSQNGTCRAGEKQIEVVAYVSTPTPTPSPTPTFSPRPVYVNSHTAITVVKDRLDSGVNGNWAKDNFTRQVTVKATSTAPLDKCGAGATKCYAYTGSLKDFGTFTTIKGATSPNDRNKTIANEVTGVIKGGTQNITFYASTIQASLGGVPRVVTGNSPATGDWVKEFFPDGTKVANIDLGDWSWNYSTRCGESWTNAKSGNSGNIIGRVVCGR